MKPARNQNIPAALVLGLYWAMIASYFGFNNAYLLANGYSDVQVGWISTIMYLLMSVCGPISGYITDVIMPARKYSILCGFISIPFMLLMPLAIHSFLAVTLVTIAISLTQYLMSGIVDAWIMRIRAYSPNLSYPITRCFGSIFYSISAYTIGLAISRFGYNFSFCANIVFVLATMAAMMFLKDVPCPGRASSKENSISFGKALGELCRNRRYVIYIIAMTLFLYGMRLTLVYQPSLIFSVGGTEAHVGAAGAIAAIFEIPFILMMTKARKFAKPVVCFFALLLGSCKGLTMIFFPEVGAYIGAQVFQSISYGFQIAFSLFYIQEITPPKLYSTAVMLYTTTNIGLACMLASLTGGYMFAASPTLMLWVSAGSMLAAAAVFALTFVKPRAARG